MAKKDGLDQHTLALLSYRFSAQVKLFRDALSLLLTDNSLFALRRARDDESLRDGVVRVSDGAIDLTPAIIQLPSQRYIARLTEINRSGAAPKPIESAVFNSTRVQSVRVDGLRPAAYRLELVVAGEYSRTGPEVWILAVDGARFPAATAAFAQAAGEAAESFDDAGTVTRQGFLRAFLLSLAADTTIGR